LGYEVIGKQRFVDVLSAAAIKESCSDDLLGGKYSVVSKANAAVMLDYYIVVKEAVKHLTLCFSKMSRYLRRREL
jgi:hypothetical protein